MPPSHSACLEAILETLLASHYSSPTFSSFARTPVLAAAVWEELHKAGVCQHDSPLQPHAHYITNSL